MDAFDRFMKTISNEIQQLGPLTEDRPVALIFNDASVCISLHPMDDGSGQKELKLNISVGEPTPVSGNVEDPEAIQNVKDMTDFPWQETGTEAFVFDNGVLFLGSDLVDEKAQRFEGNEKVVTTVKRIDQFIADGVLSEE